MTNEERPRLARVLAILSETFNEPVSDVRAEGYLMGLNDIPIEDIERGARLALKQCKFFPRPAELRELAIGDLDDFAQMEWNGWKKAARLGGAGRPILCEPATAYAISNTFGSWPAACLLELSPEMWASKFKEFSRNYKRYSLDHPGPCDLVLMRGNGYGTLESNPPLMIEGGDVFKASPEDYTDVKRLNA